jgi:chain length determinant protein EpsF
MTLNQFLRVLLARKRTVLWVLFVLLGTDVVLSLVLPKKYTAAATVYSDPKAPDPVYGYAVPGTYMSEANTPTQVDIISSDRVAIMAVRMLGLDKDPEAIAIWKDDGEGKGTIEQYWAAKLALNLDIKPSKESDVISIEYTTKSPTFAADVVNAYAKSYVQASLDLRTDPARASSEFFGARTRQLRADLEKAQQKLSDFQRSHHYILADDQRYEVENARLTDLSAQLTAIQAVHAESQSRQAAAFGHASTSPDVMQSPVVQGTLTDIAHSQARLEQLQKTLGPNHPQLLTAQAELESLHAKLAAEEKEIASSIGTSNSVNLQREADIRAALDEQKRKVLDLRAQHDEATVLQRDVDEAQKAYDMVAQRSSQTSLESLNQQANVAVLSTALPPIEPSRPRLGRNIIIGIFLGTVFGIGAALMQEMRDRRVRSLEDATQVFGLPVLVALPSARAKLSGRRSPKLPSRLQRLRFRRRALASAG